jgi:hypothetical protein
VQHGGRRLQVGGRDRGVGVLGAGGDEAVGRRLRAIPAVQALGGELGRRAAGQGVKGAGQL